MELKSQKIWLPLFFPSPTEVMLLAPFGAMIFKLPPIPTRNRQRRSREGMEVSLLPTMSDCELPSAKFFSALFFFWVKTQVARPCQTERCNFSFLRWKYRWLCRRMKNFCWHYYNGFSYVPQEMALVNSVRRGNKVNKISWLFEMVHILIVPFKLIFLTANSIFFLQTEWN